MADLEDVDIAQIIQMDPAEIIRNVKAFADVVEKFRRGMVVATLFNGREDATFRETLDGIAQDDFLRDLEHFGGALASAARARRTKNEARRTGGAYSGLA